MLLLRHHLCSFMTLVLLTSMMGLIIGESVAAKSYRPRNRRPPQSKMTTLGTRGCPTEPTVAKFMALAPQLHVGQSIAQRPTFAWYIPHQASYRLTFQLAEINPSEGQQIRYESQFDSQMGVMQFTLPESQTPLTIGKSYSWRVILHCNLDRPSDDRIAGGEVEIVDLNQTNLKGLKLSTDSTQRSQQYADAGFWYDALATSLTSPEQTKRLLEELRSLEQGDMQKIRPDYDRSIQQIIDRL